MSTTSQAAKAKGWTLLSSCEGKFPGIRYTDPSEPSLVAIYDVNGLVAGLQAVVLEKDLNSLAIESFGRSDLLPSERGKASTVYIKDLWLKEPAFFSTVLFTDPKAICNDKVKRTLEGGLGDRVVVLYDNKGVPKNTFFKFCLLLLTRGRGQILLCGFCP